MPKKKGGWKGRNIAIGEEVRIAVTLQLKKFAADPTAKECEFPSSLYAEERAYVHTLAKTFGFRSKSRGQRGVDRSVTVYKREGSSIVQADPAFSLVPLARQQITVLLRSFPVTNKERQDLLPQLERDRERDRALNADVKELNRAMGRLSSGISQVPSPHCSAELLPFRQSLPIWSLREDIMRTINTNQVVVLVGETGSGKTTQVPQFILEHSASVSKPCRIVCTEPRRISAVSVSERVAAERDEKLGQSVGYQIRLESRVSPKTVLTYCTNGVLLRTLMGGDCVLATMTHIIVDEIHERDRFSDFLLIALRDALSKFRMLRLVLMSATIDTNIFTKYFNGCPVITVPGRTYDVKEYFLEDVLKLTGFTNGRKAVMEAKLERKKQQKETLEKWTKKIMDSGPQHSSGPAAPPPVNPTIPTKNADEGADNDKADQWYVEEMDSCIQDAWLTGSQNAFSQMLYLIQTENVSVDYQHSLTSATPLMVAAGRGCIDTTEYLLNLGANTNIRASNNWTALDWAEQHNQTPTAELIRAYMKTYEDSSEFIPDLPASNQISKEDRQLLEMYHSTVRDDSVDLQLCLSLIKYIHNSSDQGAILVFLPGYDDIVTLRDLLNNEEAQLSQKSKFRLYTLHSKMQTADQKRVFQPSPPYTRKIILSTNIAETSITIDDVVYVIDSGKVKEKSYDSVMGVTSLKDEWISVACAKQRMGRAGRTQPGVCYHLFSSLWYQTLPKSQTPEILRMPIHELCLHTKLLAPPNTPIADFLARAMEPPSFMVTRNAVQLLKTIDALDPWEDLTELGHHLLDLPVEPRLGKMLLHSVLLKCLDPVLTIVCTLAYKDPFVMPAQPHLKLAAKLARKSFAANTFSDHMVLLRAFQAWQSARANGLESAFCSKNFISSATMEQVVSLRTQLLGQLRASGFVRPKGGGDIRDLNSNAENWAVVKAAISAGMYPNLVRVDRETNQLRTMKECTVTFHPSSTLGDPSQKKNELVKSLPTDWLVYDELSRSGRFCHVRSCTLVSPITVALFGGPMRLPHDALSSTDANNEDTGNQSQSDSEWEERSEGRNAMLKLDDWIVFCVDGEAAQLALHLRHKWNALFLRRMRGPAKTWSAADDAVIQAVVKVLSAEEQALGLMQPEGIGQRPRPLNIEFQPTIAPSSSSRRFAELESDSNCSSGIENLGHRVHRNNVRMYEIKGQDRGTGWNDGNADWRREVGLDGPNRGTGDTRYFVIKVGGPKSIEKSMACGLWAFTPNTEKKIVRLFKEGKNVILIYSMQGSGSFQGVARLVGDHSDVLPLENYPELTGPNLGSLLPVEWVKCGEILFQTTRHLVNPYSENRRIQASRDGQELEAGVAAQLCSLWDKTPQFGHVMHNQRKGIPPMSYQPQQHHFYHNQPGRPIRGGYYPHTHFNNGYGRSNHHPHIHK